MKVELKAATASKPTIASIAQGECFEWDGEIYMKTDETDHDGDYRLVCLKDGVICNAESDEEVTPLALKVVPDTN